MAKIIKNNIPYTAIPSSASMLPYDNYDSGLTATNVKDAIDELAGGATSITLEGLSDVTITSATSGQVLQYNGSEWVNANGGGGGASALTDLSDISISSASNGQVLTYNNGDWVNSNIPTPTISMGSLSDVEILSPSNGQILKYSNGDWINAAESVGTTVIANPSGSSTTDLTKLQVDNTIYAIPSGGSTVSVTQIQTTGTKIATITVDSIGTDLYAPAGGSGTVTSITLQANSPINIDNSSAITTSGSRTLSHATSGATAGSYGDSSAQTPTYSGTFKVPYLTVDTYGHITGVSDHNVTIPAIPNLSSIGQISISSPTNGQVLKYNGTNWVNAAESGGGSGGHTILDNEGDSLTQRTNLQFKGAYSEDNSTDDTTEVNVVRSMTKAEFNLLSADEKVGLIHITDESDATPLSDLPDVNLSSLTDGQILKYDSTNQEWVNANESGGSSSLSGLTDVNITSVSDGQILKYDSSSSKWVNGTGGGGGVSDYEDLTNKPQVNGVTLSGDKDSEDLGIVWEGTQAQYDAILTKDPNTTYYITDADDGGDNFQPVIYSEIEREIGVWVDGKPLYVISLSFDTTSNATYDVDTSALSIESLASYDFSATGNTYYYSSSDFIRGYFTDATNSTFRVVSGSSYPRCAGYVTFRYTKTTDVAGSGIWTPQGVPAIHYLTEEHIVGTWVDGKTIYEKTIAVTQGSSETSYPAPSNIDKIWFVPDASFMVSSTSNVANIGYFVTQSDRVQAYYQHSDNTIRVPSSWSGSGYITIRYTKSS